MDFKNKKFLVIGAGISGNAAAVLLKQLGAAEVVLSDANEAVEEKQDLQSVREAGVRVQLGAQTEALLEGIDAVILSPAVPMRIPLVQQALAAKIKVMSEIELAYLIAKAPIMAITGTNGKTTTTTLLGELMKKQLSDVGVGGNIGIPLCLEAERVGENGCIVAEISSYQLEASETFKPHIAVMLNVTPDHIKRHGSMECYQATKEKLFAHQSAEDYVVLNYDDEKVRSMAQRAAGTVMLFSKEQTLAEGAFVDNGVIIISWQGHQHQLCAVADMQIKGAHNVENALAAASAAFLAGVKPELIGEGLKEFGGVEHRIEPVRTINGVRYFNDSKATNTDSAIKALETFPEGHIILIAGGDDKMTDLTEFMQLVSEKTDALILVGAAAARFREAAEANGVKSIFEAGYSMQRAVDTAKAIAKEPQVVLLSPACASFDMYDSFEARGCDFKDIVNQIK